MKKDKKGKLMRIALIIVGIIALLFFFRGSIYQIAVKYEDAGGIKSYDIKDENMMKHINESLPNDESLDASINIDKIIDMSLDFTDKHLSFVLETKDNDLEKTFASGEANCVGYAAFAASVGSYLLNRFGMNKDWEAKPKKGKLYLFGNNMHKNVKSGWFKDHDFVVFKNKNTKEEIYTDPVAYEYFGTKRVDTYKK